MARVEAGIQRGGFLAIQKKEDSGLDPGGQKVGGKKRLDSGFKKKKIKLAREKRDWVVSSGVTKKIGSEESSRNHEDEGFPGRRRNGDER